MSRFSFVTDAKSESFSLEIALEMQKLFGISEDEAIGRINRQWQGLEFVGPDDIIYHEDESFWAKTIYYTDDSSWWLDGRKVAIKPYP